MTSQQQTPSTAPANARSVADPDDQYAPDPADQYAEATPVADRIGVVHAAVADRPELPIDVERRLKAFIQVEERLARMARRTLDAILDQMDDWPGDRGAKKLEHLIALTLYLGEWAESNPVKRWNKTYKSSLG